MEKKTIRILLAGRTLNNEILKKPNGFTLLELILVLLLMGLIAGLTLPFVGSTLDRITLQSEVRQIASAILFARSEAVSRKTIFTININSEKNRYWLEIPKEKEISQSKQIGETVKVIGFETTYETRTEGIFRIFFYPRGNSSGGTLRFKSLDDKDEINIYAITIDPITSKPEIIQLEG